jgi:hypothetical protein
MHVYSCDYTEAGTVLFVGNSVDDLPGIQLPAKPGGWGGDRMEITGAFLWAFCTGFSGLVVIPC